MLGEKHGMTGTPTYRAWAAMKNRCQNPRNVKFPRYGGRGIRVCLRWSMSFSTFLSDMGKKPTGKSIDRIDNDGNYEPGNCRWATPKQQSANSSHPIQDDLTKRGLSKCRKHEIRRVRKGLCMKCNDPRTDSLYCKHHRTAFREMTNRRRQKHRDSGLCVSCSRPAMRGHAVCSTHYESRRQRSKR